LRPSATTRTSSPATGSDSSTTATSPPDQSPSASPSKSDKAMTDRLRVPEALTGPYEHALICTYGAPLTFYEQDLWRKLGRARNRIVLADQIRLAETLVEAADAGTRLRHLNIDYVASPITSPHAAHAKLVLLAGPDAGLLLVGSGNLGIDGYASQG